MAQKHDKLGNQTLYVLRTSVANFDKEKLENYRWKEGLEYNINNVLNFGIKPEDFFMDYAGVSTDLDERLNYHLRNPNNIFCLAEKKPFLIHKEPLGEMKTSEAEIFEKLFIENREEFYLQLFLERDIFVWPYGPYYDNGGRAQEKHPYPDKKDKMPEWFRNNKDIIEAHIAAKNVSSKNIEF